LSSSCHGDPDRDLRQDQIPPGSGQRDGSGLYSAGSFSRVGWFMGSSVVIAGAANVGVAAHALLGRRLGNRAGTLQRLNAEGVLSPAGGAWQAGNVHRALARLGAGTEPDDL
jgi:hypothetical protein